MSTFDKQYEQLETDGHLIFDSNYDYDRFVHELTGEQLEKLLLLKNKLEVWLIF
jgi:hypothetical protein